MFLWRYPWVLPLAVLIAVGVGAFVGARVAGPRVTDTVTSTIAAPVNPERLPLADAAAVPRSRDPQRPERTGRLGDALADGGVTFRTTAFRQVRSRRPSTRLYEAVIEWRNTTSEPITLFCGSDAAQVLDPEDNGYDLEDEDDLVPRSKKDERCDDQQPGSGDTVTVTFELPRGRPPVALALWNAADTSDSQGETFVLVRLPRRL